LTIKRPTIYDYSSKFETMKKFIFLIVLTCIIPTVAWSQTTCFPDGVLFQTQAEIDSFQVNNPGCTEIEGLLEIGTGKEVDITNLNGFSVLTALGHNLNITFTKLTSLTGLDNLESVGGDVTIDSNLTVTELNLSSLTTIGGSLNIYNNNTLNGFTGLSTVTSIGAALAIENNDALISLAGLDSIEASSINSLKIVDNDLLAECDVESICNYLANPSGSVVIESNATGCNTQEEVYIACGLGVPSIDIESEISIYPNPANDKLSFSSEPGFRIDEVTIYNQIGQKVIHREGSINTIDVSNLEKGMYIGEVVSNGLKFRMKLIIR